MVTISDQNVREEALDPGQSFIVQAPAGSGKTELLTRRFLKLLTVVKQPEEILAITFTRKAAYEMRERILKRLREAPQTNDLLAQQALAHSENNYWNLLQMPNRLHILTIDAFCSSLVQKAPFLSEINIAAQIAEDADALYQEAVEKLLLQIDEANHWSAAIKLVLRYLNNRTDHFQNLLVDMLKRRDHWLSYIVNFPDRQKMENGLSAITEECLENIAANFPGNDFKELLTLLPSTDTPKPLPEKRNWWLSVISVLLTDQNEWRKSFTKNQGFNAPTEGKTKEEKEWLKERKARMTELVEVLSKQTHLYDALVELRLSPPMQYTDQEWALFQALTQLLPVACAQLKIVFDTHHQVDFTEIAMGAIRTLGGKEAPSNLALRLDYRLQHILVDEFQDTSITQFRLLEQLTAGWTPGDGHSLFLVGDPMQSIYRFRNAEVGLFLRARHEGINAIPLKSLFLKTNFRSTPPLVEWMNQTFQTIFPETEDISKGAVTHYPSEAMLHENSANEPATIVHPLINPDPNSEAQTIADIIKKEKQNNPQSSIAILVRARHHLKTLLPILHAEHIEYEAVDIDPLGDRMVIQDLFSLTKALLNPADRLAWFSVLRAPWCGLTLKDLTCLAGHSKPPKTIWQLINDPAIFQTLSSDGQKRLSYFISVVKDAGDHRENKSITDWVSETWRNLKGPALLRNDREKQEVARYWNLLDECEEIRGDSDVDRLKNALEKLFASSASSPSAIQIMTIHKAKGLEFDVIILPALEKLPRRDDPELLLWTERPRKHQRQDLLLAPFTRSQDGSTIYDYLRYLDSEKARLEEIRLLYVAATRAKRKLHLIGSVNAKDTDTPLKAPRNSFLNWLWPSIQSPFLDHPIQPSTTIIPIIPSKKLRRRTIESFA